MRVKRTFHVSCLSWTGLALLMCLIAATLAWADEPVLAVRLAAGESACYPESGVDQVSFQGDTLIVVWTGGIDHWRVDTIARIEFLWNPANSASPRDAAALLKAVHLFQSQPNPFSAETRIAFNLPRAGKVELTIFTVGGGRVRKLVDGPREAGRQTVTWDGRDDAGKKVGSGVYFYRLAGSGVDESRRVILLP